MAPDNHNFIEKYLLCSKIDTDIEELKYYQLIFKDNCLVEAYFHTKSDPIN